MDTKAIADLTKHDIDSMSGDEYSAAFSDPATGNLFAAKVEALEHAPTRPRRQRTAENAPAVSFDPSFDEGPATQQSESAPVSRAPIDESLPELIHEYQPVDRNGRPVGGMQRFKYRTQDELIEKLTAAHKASSARIRELSRDRRLEEIASVSASKTPPMPSDKVPETVSELATELRAVRESNYLLAVRAALAEFSASANWQRFRSDENAQSLVLAVQRSGDDPTDPQSFHRAFEAMREFIQPAVQTVVTTSEANAATILTPVTTSATPETPKRVHGVATGLSRLDASEELSVEPVRQETPFYTIQQLNAMPSEQMRKLLRNPATAAKIDAVYESARRR